MINKALAALTALLIITTQAIQVTQWDAWIDDSGDGEEERDVHRSQRDLRRGGNRNARHGNRRNYLGKRNNREERDEVKEDGRDTRKRNTELPESVWKATGSSRGKSNRSRRLGRRFRWPPPRPSSGGHSDRRRDDSIVGNAA